MNKKHNSIESFCFPMLDKNLKGELVQTGIFKGVIAWGVALEFVFGRGERGVWVTRSFTPDQMPYLRVQEQHEGPAFMTPMGFWGSILVEPIVQREGFNDKAYQGMCLKIGTQVRIGWGEEVQAIVQQESRGWRSSKASTVYGQYKDKATLYPYLHTLARGMKAAIGLLTFDNTKVEYEGAHVGIALSHCDYSFTRDEKMVGLGTYRVCINGKWDWVPELVKNEDTKTTPAVQTIEKEPELEMAGMPPMSEEELGMTPVSDDQSSMEKIQEAFALGHLNARDLPSCDMPAADAKGRNKQK